jgi:membrane protease YdiL (CAAX protease family)
MMRKYKIIVGILIFLIMFSILTGIIFAQPSKGLINAKTKVKDEIKTIVDDVVIPILDVLLVGALVIAIVKAVLEYRERKELELGWIVIIIIGLILVNTFSQWGWQMI